MTPFLTVYTPTFRRPQGLARCLASVQNQTAVQEIEQIVIPDHVGIGVGGMYQRVRHYADAVHGRYVTFLCDDDVLAGPTVVERVWNHAEQHANPPLILVATNKGGAVWPAAQSWPPQLGQIDLNCAIVRADIWKRYVSAYGARYEGDFDFLETLYQHGVWASWCDVLFSTGHVSRGAAEVAA